MRDSNPAPSARRDNTLPLHHWGWLHNFEEKSFKKSDLMPFGWTFRRQDDQALLTGLLPVKKTMQTHIPWQEWMEEHNYALQTLQNDDTRPRLQSRTQSICFVISISAVILKQNGQNDIHFRLIQVLKSSMAWYFLTFTTF